MGSSLGYPHPVFCPPPWAIPILWFVHPMGYPHFDLFSASSHHSTSGATRDVIANPSTLADLPAVPLTKPIASQEENVPVATKPTPLTS